MIGASKSLNIQSRIAAMPASQPGKSGWARRALPPIAAGLCAGLFYALTIQTREAHVDEYYHLLAGRSWLHDGSFAILDGVYNRARLFTVIVASSMDLFDRADLLTARIPSVVFSAATVAIVVAWLRHAGAAWGAMVAALLLGLSGYTLDVAHFARFYALHAALILIAAACLFIGTRAAAHSRPAWLASAALCLATAMHLQPVTAIAIVGLAAWLAYDQRVLLMHLLAPWRPMGVVALLVSLVAAMAAAALLGERAMDDFLHVERWAAASQHQPLYYLDEFLRQMPLLTIAWPFAVVLGWRRHPALAALCAIMVGVCLLLHSFAGMKAWRYAYYCLPFFCMSFGLAFESLMKDEKPGDDSKRRYATRAAAVAALLALLIFGSPVYRHSMRLTAPHLARLVVHPALIGAPVPDGAWEQASPALRALAAQEPLIVTGDDLRTLAHVGHFDIFISHSRLGELNPPQDFNRDFRTGRTLIDSAKGMSAVIDCNAKGVVIVSDAQWRNEMGVRPEVARLIERRTAAVAIGGDFHVFRWQHAPRGGRCPSGDARRASRQTARPACFPRWQPGLSRQSCPPATLEIAARPGAA